MPRPRPLVLLLHLFLLALLLGGPALPARAQSATPPGPSLTGPFAGYELVEASYLLRAPDGSLLRVTRPGPGGTLRATPSHRTPAAGAPALRPVIGLQGWLGSLLLHTPEMVEQVSDAVHQMWALILRLLDYLGVVVLLVGSWGVWFLARPALIGVSDRMAFLFVFVLASGLWAYVTGLYLSIAYALGLILLPAAVAAVLAFLGRRLLALFRRPAATEP